MAVYVPLDGYVVRKTTDLAVAVSPVDEPFSEWVWLPRLMCEDGDDLVEGDEDIAVRESIALDKGLIL